MTETFRVNYVTKIEISIMHDKESDVDGADDVLMNIVRKWDYPITPSVFQRKPVPVNDEISMWVEAFLGV